MKDIKLHISMNHCVLILASRGLFNQSQRKASKSSMAHIAMHACELDHLIQSMVTVVLTLVWIHELPFYY